MKEKKIISIPHIWSIIAAPILSFSPFYLVFGLLSKLYSEREPVPNKGYFAIIFFASIGFFALLVLVYFVKVIIISKNRIKIVFPFRLKFYEYEASELKIHKIHYKIGSKKDYETTHFQTVDNKLFLIMQYEYWNYKKLRDFIVENSSAGEISKYHNLKVVLIGLIISVIMAVGLIIIFNVVIT